MKDGVAACLKENWRGQLLFTNQLVMTPHFSYVMVPFKVGCLNTNCGALTSALGLCTALLDHN